MDPIGVKTAELHLPHFIWVMEIAPLSHYLQGRCTGEIVIDATSNFWETDLLYLRSGAILLLNGQRISANATGTNLGSFEQYTHNLGEM